MSMFLNCLTSCELENILVGIDFIVIISIKLYLTTNEINNYNFCE
jgi:hypothetical protein